MLLPTRPIAVQAVILAGGKGSRISSLFPDLPKALIPVCGEPLLQRQLWWLGRQGIHDVVLATGHLSCLIEEWVERAYDEEWRVSISREDRALGTGGGLRHAEALLESDPVLVLNGDSLLPSLNLPLLIESHQSNECPASLAVVPSKNSARFGSIRIDPDGKVTKFAEKEDVSEDWVNAGIYVIDRVLLSGIGEDQPVSLEYDVFPELVRRGELQAIMAAPPLLDMGTPDGLLQMEAFFKEQQQAD